MADVAQTVQEVLDLLREVEGALLAKERKRSSAYTGGGLDDRRHFVLTKVQMAIMDLQGVKKG